MKSILATLSNTGKGLKLISCFLSILCILLTTSCKKELKAGAPLTLTYDKVYMIGDATTAAWTIANAVPMTKSTTNTDEFSWTGPLTAGEIKFPTALSFSSDTFGAAVNGQAVNNSKGQILPGGNPDIKWKLTSSEAGNYKVTLNTKEITVIFQKM